NPALGWLPLVPSKVTRKNRHLAHPDHRAGEVQGGEEIDGASVVACGDVAKVFEPVEETLDPVAQSVGEAVMRDDELAGRDRGDHSLCPGLGDHLAQGIAVVSLIGNDPGRRLAGEEIGGGGAVVRLAAGQDEAQGTALGVGQGVDLGRQSASGTPHSLIFGPPFPPAACWWTRTSVVSSIRYWLSGSVVSESNTRSHTPALAQRVKRLCMLFHLPYRSGRSCHQAPDRSTHKTAFTNSRLSTPVRPRSPGLPGSRCAIRCHCASESSYRPIIIRAPARQRWRPMNHTFRRAGIPNVDWS